MGETYTGVKSRVSDTRVGKGVGSVISRFLDISERTIDTYLPDQGACEHSLINLIYFVYTQPTFESII